MKYKAFKSSQIVRYGAGVSCFNSGLYLLFDSKIIFGIAFIIGLILMSIVSNPDFEMEIKSDK